METFRSAINEGISKTAKLSVLVHGKGGTLLMSNLVKTFPKMRGVVLEKKMKDIGFAILFVKATADEPALALPCCWAPGCKVYDTAKELVDEMVARLG